MRKDILSHRGPRESHAVKFPNSFACGKRAHVSGVKGSALKDLESVGLRKISLMAGKRLALLRREVHANRDSSKGEKEPAHPGFITSQGVVLITPRAARDIHDMFAAYIMNVGKRRVELIEVKGEPLDDRFGVIWMKVRVVGIYNAPQDPEVRELAPHRRGLSARERGGNGRGTDFVSHLIIWRGGSLLLCDADASQYDVTT